MGQSGRLRTRRTHRTRHCIPKIWTRYIPWTPRQSNTVLGRGTAIAEAGIELSGWELGEFNPPPIFIFNPSSLSSKIILWGQVKPLSIASSCSVYLPFRIIQIFSTCVVCRPICVSLRIFDTAKDRVRVAYTDTHYIQFNTHTGFSYVRNSCQNIRKCKNFSTPHPQFKFDNSNPEYLLKYQIGRLM